MPPSPPARTLRLLGAALAPLLAACGVVGRGAPPGPDCDGGRGVVLGDTVHRVVHATLAPIDSGGPAALPEGYAGLVLQEVARALAVPRRLSLGAGEGALGPIVVVREPGDMVARVVLPDETNLDRGYSLETAVDVGVRADGRLLDPVVSGVASEPELTRALVVAALAADSLRAIPARPPGADTALVRVRIALALEPRSALVSLPVFRAALPRPFDRRPAARAGLVGRPGFRPRPSTGAEWTAELRFVLDESGRPMEGTIETLAATDSAWAAAARRALVRTRYTPAILEGCPVRVRLVQRWTYLSG